MQAHLTPACKPTSLLHTGPPHSCIKAHCMQAHHISSPLTHTSHFVRSIILSDQWGNLIVHHYSPHIAHSPHTSPLPTYKPTYLAMKGHLPFTMICFSEKMCSCWRVSTICFFLRHLRAKVLVESFFS